LEAAGGALLLFLTNGLAILGAGAVVFGLVGLGKTVVLAEQVRFRRRSLLIVVAGLGLLIIPLAMTAYESVVSAEENANATADVQQWLTGTTYKLDTVNATDGNVAITIEGTGQIKAVQPLAKQLSTAFGRPVVVDVRALAVQTATSSSP
jgi:amino acid transporter